MVNNCPRTRHKNIALPAGAGPLDCRLRLKDKPAHRLVKWETISGPLRYRDDPTDYIPSQKLAELIEEMGIDGIRYPSAMAPGGTNVVLFDPSVTEVGDSRLVEIVQTTVEYRDAKDR